MTDFSRIRITQSDQPPGSGAVRLDNFPPAQGVDDPPPGYGAVRLGDLLNPPPPPLPPERQAFEAKVARIMRIRGLPRSKAETAAFQIALIDRLNSTHPDMPSDRCAYCSRSETPDAILLPIGVSERHAWLHDRCWEAWRARRREAAIRELAAMGVAAQ
jgi:hypothetical protein